MFIFTLKDGVLFKLYYLYTVFIEENISKFSTKP